MVNFENGKVPINDTNLNKMQADLLGEMRGTILYKDETGTAETISLNEASTNSDRIKITYKDMYGVYGSIEIYNPDGKSIDLKSLRNGAQSIVIMNAIVSINGAVINWDSNYRYSLSTNEYVDEKCIYITEVVGYKEA